MIKSILSLVGSLALVSASALAHSGIELGPNGGRIVEFSKDETLHGELTLKDGQFRISLLDHAMKPVKLESQVVTASGGPTGKAMKLEVTRAGDQFVLPAVKPGEWLILQYRPEPKAKPITARVEYNTATCPECKAQEWLCKCSPDQEKKAGK